MRLLELTDEGAITLQNFEDPYYPPYAILSHTWGKDCDEVTFNDLQDATHSDEVKGKSGYRKIEFCEGQARKDGLKHFWIDSCCINQANLNELTEAINSMFRWYQAAKKCYVYLSDVSSGEESSNGQTHSLWETAFRKSRWFTRGWTLQELLAPKSVEFFTREGECLGDKNKLEQLLHGITGIPITALHGSSLSNFSIRDRKQWAANRKTRKKEDEAYCLFGIFHVSMPLVYGEGRKRAHARLDKEINGLPEEYEFIAWLTPTRPEVTQAEISASRHPGMGQSFATGRFMSWLQDTSSGRTRLMWINAGTGKSTLFSYLVETTEEFASHNDQTIVAYHYCAFSDPDSLLPVNILGSLVVQIAAETPIILDDLNRIYEKDKTMKKGKTLQAWELEKALANHIPTSSMPILLLDALDECRDFPGIISCIRKLLDSLPNLKVLVTGTSGAAAAGTSSHLEEVQMNPEEDIRSFVEARVSGHPALRDLSLKCKAKVRSELIGKADQTFRWVALTLDDLCKQRTGKGVLEALEKTPEGLNQNYASMLSRISSDQDRLLAREALLWLCFAMRPVKLQELNEAAILRDSQTTLDQDCRLHQPKIILEICRGFLEYDDSTERVRLAHSSVRSYLLSDYAKNSDNSFFSFTVSEGNQTLMRRCLMYLMFDDFKSGIISAKKGKGSVFRSEDNKYFRRRNFPLLDYAARYWGLHASFATDSEWTLAERLFSTKALPGSGNFGAWVSCLIPDCDPRVALKTDPLYYAASFGMVPLVKHLLSESTLPDIDRPGGRFGSTPLQVACFRGRREVVEILFENGADFWSIDKGSRRPAWFWVHSNRWTHLLNEMVAKRPEIEVLLGIAEGDIAWVRRARESDGVSIQEDHGGGMP